MVCKLYHGVLVIYICVSFKKVSQTVFKLHSGHKYIREITIFTVQMAITPKVGQPELPFLYSEPCLMLLYIYVKFHQNIWNSFQLTERTQVYSRNGYFQYLLCLKGHNSKVTEWTRVHCKNKSTASIIPYHSNYLFMY